MKRSFLTTPIGPLIRLWYGNLWFVGSDRSDGKYDAIKHILLNIRVTVFQQLQLIAFIAAAADERIGILQQYQQYRDSCCLFIFFKFPGDKDASVTHECSDIRMPVRPQSWLGSAGSDMDVLPSASSTEGVMNRCKVTRPPLPHQTSV